MAELTSGFENAGAHQAIWDASGQASGIYFVVLHAGQHTSRRNKVVLMK